MRALVPLLLLVLASCGGGAEPEPTPPPDDGAASDEQGEARHRMVERQIAARGITDARVLGAMRTVPRHAFVPETWRAYAYGDTALPIGMEQTISQPFIVASMTEAAEIGPDDRVLEIGTGSGYQAAVLAELTPHVYTIEIVEELAVTAKALLERLGYTTIRCRTGDGYAGWPDAAPFDAILVTAAPDEPPPALLEQLRPGGRMIIPLDRGAAAQALVRITKSASGEIESETLYPVSFVPFTRSSDHE